MQVTYNKNESDNSTFKLTTNELNKWRHAKKKTAEPTNVGWIALGRQAGGGYLI